MNDKKVIAGLRAVRNRFYGWAFSLGIVAVFDWACLEGKAVKLFTYAMLVAIVIGGTISTFIEAYEKDN